MSNVKIIGYPGVGKTTYMNKLVVGWIEDDVDPSDIIYTSFSRAAAQSIKEKLDDTLAWVGKLSNYAFREAFPYFGTTHSISSRLLKLRDENFIRDKMRIEWCKQNDLTFKKTGGKKNEDEEDEGDYVVSRDIPENTGNLVLEYFQTVKRLGYIGDNAAEGVNDRVGMTWRIDKNLPDYVQDDLINLFYSWEEFRQTREVYDYEDMFEEIVLDEIYPGADYMVIDESHDCYPLQKMIYDVWKENGCIENVYVAIDPNQTIYQHLGCSPYLFDDWFVGAVPFVLPKSWRLPELILNEVKAVAEQLGDTTIKQVESNGEKGEVKDVYDYEIEKLMYDVTGTSFVLFRFNKDIQAFIRSQKDAIIDLKVCGMGRSTKTSWNYPSLTNLCNFKYCWLHDENNFSYPDVKEFITRTPIAYLVRGAKTKVKKAKKDRAVQGTLIGGKQTSAFTRSEVMGFFKGHDVRIASIIGDDKFRVTPAQRSILTKCDEPITRDSFKIHLGTIHSSKGLEADNVFFHNWRPETWMNQKNELRVEYVGKSRAHKRLFMVH